MSSKNQLNWAGFITTQLALNELEAPGKLGLFLLPLS